ncbi:Uncharacterised protein [Alistipes sp. cv1]|nr:Uncharacterised protein [Faecalibacterium prausnitzii]
MRLLFKKTITAKDAHNAPNGIYLYHPEDKPINLYMQIWH